MRMRWLAGVSFVAFCLLASAPLSGQLQTGRLLGTVLDEQHAVVPGASVTVTNLATNISRTVTSDAQGTYVVTPLEPGIYRISASLQGFQTTIRDRVELTVGQSARVELMLSVGALSTDLVVTAKAPLLNTESATLSHIVTNVQIVDLPLNGRSFHELAKLTPGTALLPPTGNVQTVRPENVNGNIIGGISGQQTRFLLDGVDITEEHQGGTWIQTSVDALQEFSVQQNAYSAEFHGAGGTFNAVTKSGSNTFRGSVFEFLRNDAFDEKNFFAAQKEKLERNQFGGTLGGPILRGRTFFFASYEGQRRDQGNVVNVIVPSAAQRGGDFRGGAPIYDPLTTAGNTRTAFANNTIPQARISPQAQFFLQYIPLPNTTQGTYTANPITVFDSNQVTLRADQQISSRHRLFVRFSRHHSSEETPAAFPLGSTLIEGPAYNLAGEIGRASGREGV